MGYGSTGKILRVDLTRGTTHVEDIDAELYRRLPGGKALAANILLREVPPGADPLGPENVLILANGLLTGAPVSTATRFTAVAHSPLTGAFGESEAGGFWGPELKAAGFEAIVVTGQASEPVYLWVKDGQAEIRDAGHLWGHDPDEVQATLRQELGDKLVRVLQIGLGAENLVRYGAITNELRHYNGRSGMGTVMGSKKLKAIAVRGSGRYLDLAQDRDTLAELGRTLAKQVPTHPQSWDMRTKGTPGLPGGLNAGGILPTNNFHSGSFAGIDNIRWEAYEKELLIARRSCYACAVRCKPEIGVADKAHPSAYGGPEYEAIAGFSSLCGVDDIHAVAAANEKCGRYTLDAISTSACIAFAMECYEHELIGPGDTGGLELRFGNAEAMLKMVDMIAHREGLGDLLAEGTRRAAQVIGGDAPFFSLTVKGQELPMHDPRGKVAVGLGYAVNEGGADHVVAFHDPLLQNAASVTFQGAVPLGVSEPVPARELSPRKAALYARMENWTCMEKVTGFCFFGPAPRSFIQAHQVVDAVRAATGWDVTVEDLMAMGERATNLARIFNLRQGFTRQDDTLPDRLFEPLEGGALTGVSLSRTEFEEAMTALYACKGWDPQTATPTRARLEALGIGWAADWLPASTNASTESSASTKSEPA